MTETIFDHRRIVALFAEQSLPALLGIFVAGVDVMATNTNVNPALQNDNAQPHEGRSFQNDPALDFVLVKEIQPPRRIDLARERMLMCRLYLGLIRTMSDDYGAEFTAHSDSATFRTIGIYVFLRTTMCSPARASTIAQALRIPRAIVLRRLQEMVKQGYVERVGNAYRVTDKVNIPDLSKKITRRIDMIIETARELSALKKHHETNPPERSFEPDHPSGGA
jgi:DNA-binding MarR family transcriptional regulator